MVSINQECFPSELSTCCPWEPWMVSGGAPVQPCPPSPSEQSLSLGAALPWSGPTSLCCVFRVPVFYAHTRSYSFSSITADSSDAAEIICYDRVSCSPQKGLQRVWSTPRPRAEPRSWAGCPHACSPLAVLPHHALSPSRPPPARSPPLPLPAFLLHQALSPSLSSSTADSPLPTLLFPSSSSSLSPLPLPALLLHHAFSPSSPPQRSPPLPSPPSSSTTCSPPSLSPLHSLLLPGPQAASLHRPLPSEVSSVLPRAVLRPQPLDSTLEAHLLHPEEQQNGGRCLCRVAPPRTAVRAVPASQLCPLTPRVLGLGCLALSRPLLRSAPRESRRPVCRAGHAGRALHPGCWVSPVHCAPELQNLHSHRVLQKNGETGLRD
ncbi:vegetative cell wall protein gp1-like [Cervus canadensis]|uniref:vegetative cell wall protein gp1-like n=1 Tax=Cervus canadensis TaxID=1574408 RepID=UPI001CA35E58|nr:vegetative cell wall protein gp1-like [Cervus canadensis]